MALFDFLKTVGKKLFDHNEHNVDANAPAGANAGIEGKIKTYLDSLNLGLGDASVKVEGDKVTLNGNAGSQEALEKAIDRKSTR